MQGVGIFIAALVLIIFLALQAEQGGFFRTALPEGSDTTVNDRPTQNRNETISAAETRPSITDQEAERRIQGLYEELDTLSEELRALKLREPASPHRESVTLSAGNAWSSDPTREYVMLRAESWNDSPVNISDWYLESYVTENRAAIPQGARLLKSFRSRNDEDILLLPGEQAYLLTGELPVSINVSFHENACSGYLAHEADFYPTLSYSCPYPIEELENFANVPLDDDSCYDFVESLGICEHVGLEDVEEANDLSGRCQRFLENSLNYNGCVANHMNDPLFDDVGDWRIYLDRRSELWRSEREIIRLMDAQDRVIDVIEY